MGCLALSVVTLIGKSWDPWEGSFKANISSGSIERQSIELFLIGFHVFDEVDKVAWLLEELEILSINHVSKLIFDLDYQLDGVE